MPASQIIVMPRKETTESDKLAKIIAMEKMTTGIAGISEMFNKGIAAYQEAKKRKQDKDLAGIGAAAALVGGYDMLPQDTKNKLPGILDVDLPRDESGNVVITPSAKDLTDRAIKEALAKDPEGFARVAAGIQEKAVDPTQAALTREQTAQKDRADQLNARLKLLEQDRQDNRTAFEQNQQNQRNADTLASHEKIAGQTAEKENQPSGLWLDRKTGKTMDRRAAEMTLDLGEKFDDRFWQPTHKQIKEINERDSANARVDRSRIQNETDQTRQAYMEARIKKLGDGPNGDLMAAALVGLRRAQIADNSDSTPATKAAVESYSKEIQRLVGMDTPPEDHGFLIRNFNMVLDTLNTWYRGKYGTIEPGPTATPPRPAEPTVATPKEKIVPAEKPLKAGGGTLAGKPALKGKEALQYLGIEE